MSNILMQFNSGLADITTSVLPSLVQIRSGRTGVGAGVIWRSGDERALVVTNAHVVEGSRRGQRGRRGRRTGPGGSLAVTLSDGRTLDARLLGRDPAHDLAALEVDTRDLAKQPVAIAPGDSRALTAGEVVVAFGHPFGITGAATAGVVISVGTELPNLARSGLEWLAASLQLRPGHSGGAMVDAGGRLVGINTLMNGPEVGVAVPVHVVQAFVAALASRPMRGESQREGRQAQVMYV